MSKHGTFIYKPIESIIEEACTATLSIGVGIETFPLSGYLLQTIFINMTGFQEQKLKCIAWDIATEDFEFRRTFLNEGDKGFSTYESKNSLYRSLIGMLGIKEIPNDIRKDMKNKIPKIMSGILKDSTVIYWNEPQYKFFMEKFQEEIIIDNFGKQNLLSDKLNSIYSDLYYHRNKIAHNTSSYQHNLPTLIQLEKFESTDQNFLIWFFELILIDRMFIYLFHELEKLQNKFIHY